MAVAFNAATGTNHTTDTSTGTTINNANLTVGSGANRALLAFVSIFNSTIPTGMAAYWDTAGTNQAMTLITQASGSGKAYYVALFGLLAPTSGNKNLQVSWSSPSTEAHLAAAAFTGVDQTSVAVAFPNSVSSTAASGTSGTTGAITSATADMVAALFVQDIAYFASTSGTTIDKDTTAGGNFSMASMYASGASTVTCTAAWGGGTAGYGYAGTDIKAAAAVASARYAALRQYLRR